MAPATTATPPRRRPPCSRPGASTRWTPLGWVSAQTRPPRLASTLCAEPSPTPPAPSRTLSWMARPSTVAPCPGWRQRGACGSRSQPLEGRSLLRSTPSWPALARALAARGCPCRRGGSRRYRPGLAALPPALLMPLVPEGGQPSLLPPLLPPPTLRTEARVLLQELGPARTTTTTTTTRRWRGPPGQPTRSSRWRCSQSRAAWRAFAP
mmetsp:Transcript_19143/g.73242  ORF Transcript_19143/g.73242 Transcript_19143/m.73242 type:complete len:209 (-) Transcript_19143:974-1600(-)